MSSTIDFSNQKIVQASKELQRLRSQMKTVALHATNMAKQFSNVTLKMAVMSRKLSAINFQHLSISMKKIASDAGNMAKKFSGSMSKVISKSRDKVKEVAVGKLIKAKEAAPDLAKSAVKNLIQQTDAYTNIQTKLKGINKGQESVASFNNKIFQSANNVRGNYEDMVSTVSELGSTSGNQFKNNDELVSFSELLTKSFKIGASSADEQREGVSMVSKAMASGTLDGESFLSVMKNAPSLAQAIAKEMNLPVEKIQELSEKGGISSDIIKRAMLNSSDTINQQFSQLPMTFSEAAIKIKNTLMQKLAPTFEKISNWLNSDTGKSAIDTICNVIGKVVEQLPMLCAGLETIFQFVKPIFDLIIQNKGIAAIIATFIVALIPLIKSISVLKTLISGIQMAIMLFTSPIGLIIVAIAALIAIGVLLWKNWDVIKAKAAELWGNICEFFGAIGSAIGDAFTGAMASVGQFFDWIGGKLSDFVEKLEGIPVIGDIITGVKSIFSGGGTNSSAAHMGGKALGTAYWRGGFTYINERGGEIIDLPNGSRVIPSDKSKKMLGGVMNQVTININGVGKSTGEILNELVPQLKLAIANM